ncbi:alpha-catulin-like isoform X2 [Rhopilema esculentum]|uniref:alpha-catulin-like isoform X2 n=1 Tax=Rhopilema esculentum TaxID=499914 RepID=UPI0031DEE149
MARWDAKNLEIRTRSVEQALVPLVAQITTLVNLKERIKLTDKSKQILKAAGTNIQKAIDSFSNVGQTIAAENDDIADDMNETCSEALKSGEIILKLTDLNESLSLDKAAIVQVSRVLLGSITRSLLLADVVAVKKLVRAAEKVDEKLRELENVHIFTDFVQAFSQFGADMVELAHVSGDRQNDLKDDKQRAEMCAARAVLEKSTMMLLTSCKTCLRHPDSPLALGNRSGVFQCMRTAMSTLKEIVQENSYEPSLEMSRGLGMEFKDFEVAVEVLFQRPDDTEIRPEIMDKLKKIISDSENLINSEFIPSPKKNRIMAYCANLRDLLQDLIGEFKTCSDESLDESLCQLLKQISKIMNDINTDLTNVSLDLLTEVFINQAWKPNLQKLRLSSVNGDPGSVDLYGEKLEEDSRKMKEVSKLICNITQSEPVVITANKIEENMKIFLPQLVSAAKILSGHPSSKISLENMEVFANVWETQVEEWTTLLRNVTHFDKRCGSEPSQQERCFESQ